MSKLSRQRSHLIDLINQLETVIYEPLYDKKWTNSGHWDYVAYSILDFITHLDEAHQLLGKRPNLKFLDVGCGIGTKVHLANLFFDAYGIELSPDYARVARKINRGKKFLKYGRYEKLESESDKKKIFQKDALNFNYRDYDVIYFFRPMNNNAMQTSLEHRIFKQAKDGAIIIPIYAISTFPKNIKKLSTPSGQLFAKVENSGQSRQLVRLAKKLFGQHNHA